MYQLNTLVKEKEERIQALMSKPEPGASAPQNDAFAKNEQSVQQQQQQSKESSVDFHPDSEQTAKSRKQEIFEQFLDLRKKLRRSLFRGEEVFTRIGCISRVIDSLIVFSRR